MGEPNLDRWAREVAEQLTGSIWLGLSLTLVFHLLVQVPAFFLIMLTVPSEEGPLAFAFYPLMFIGLSQAIYIIPAVLIFRRRGEAETAKGLIIGASITFLLNAACNGFLFINR